MAFLWQISSLVVLVLMFLYPQKGSAEKLIGLKLSSFDPNHIKGKYLYTDSLGMQFDILPGFMQIKTLAGNETITSYMKVTRDMTYFQIADRGFLRLSNKEVVVPAEIPKTPRFLKQFVKEQFSNTVQHPRQVQVVAEAHKEALDKIRNMEETRLLEICSKALADEGGSGPTMKITQPYHLMSLNLLLALDKAGKPVDVIRAPETPDQETPHRSKRCTDLRSDPNNDNCYGMCGRKCTCWRWVCGDCCRHTGCAQHDYCCAKDFWSKYCLFPWRYNFSCSSYGGYYRC